MKIKINIYKITFLHNNFNAKSGVNIKTYGCLVFIPISSTFFLLSSLFCICLDSLGWKDGQVHVGLLVKTFI